MVTLEQAKQTFHKMVEEAPRKYTIEKIWEIQFEEPIYAMIVHDEDGVQYFPGEVFPSINKKDGSLTDWSFPEMG